MKKRIGILTGGGDVQALNAVIASAQSAANALNIELAGNKRVISNHSEINLVGTPVL